GGARPRLDRELTGCPFRPRCDSYFDPCARDHPVLTLVAPGHLAACHLTGLPADERARREGARPLGGSAGSRSAEARSAEARSAGGRSADGRSSDLVAGEAP